MSDPAGHPGVEARASRAPEGGPAPQPRPPRRCETPDRRADPTHSQRRPSTLPAAPVFVILSSGGPGSRGPRGHHRPPLPRRQVRPGPGGGGGAHALPPGRRWRPSPEGAAAPDAPRRRQLPESPRGTRRRDEGEKTTRSLSQTPGSRDASAQVAEFPLGCCGQGTRSCRPLVPAIAGAGLPVRSPGTRGAGDSPAGKGAAPVAGRRRGPGVAWPTLGGSATPTVTLAGARADTFNSNTKTRC